MSDKTEGKDGTERVLARTKKGFKEWRRFLDQQGHLDRWKNAIWDTHAFTNLFTEGAKSGDDDIAYFNGHLIIFLMALLVVLVIAIGVALVFGKLGVLLYAGALVAAWIIASKLIF